VRTLLIEDDAVLGAGVRDYLSRTGDAVDWMQTLSDASEATRSVAYDLVLLDLRLPDGSGLGFLRALRSGGNKTPVIILTAHDQISDRIEGLDSGADDYLVKPFNLGELSARISAVTRRFRGNASTTVKFGSLEINASDRRVSDGSGQIDLSAREWAVLDALAARPGAIISKARIEEALYAFGSEIESNTVEVYVSRLRKKLGKDRVETVRGIGYKLVGSP
jgi:two-component system, OmpR family, response regulator